MNRNYAPALQKLREHTAVIFAIVFLFQMGLMYSLDTMSFAAGCQELYDGVLRLHILADSDDPRDQYIKEQVRDRVLLAAEKLHLGENCETMEQLTAQAKELLPELIAAAQEEVYRQGSDDLVAAEIGRMYFDTREYENFTMPAGEYQAVRFTIGSGKGKNWWCVLFPQLCLPAAFSKPEEKEEFSPTELRVLQARPRYEPRFALLELLHWLGWRK